MRKIICPRIDWSRMLAFKGAIDRLALRYIFKATSAHEATMSGVALNITNRLRILKSVRVMVTYCCSGANLVTNFWNKIEMEL